MIGEENMFMRRLGGIRVDVAGFGSSYGDLCGNLCELVGVRWFVGSFGGSNLP